MDGQEEKRDRLIGANVFAIPAVAAGAACPDTPKLCGVAVKEAEDADRVRREGAGSPVLAYRKLGDQPS